MRITIIYKYQEGDTVKTTSGLNRELYLLMKGFGYWLLKGGRDKKGRVYRIYSNEKRKTVNIGGLRGAQSDDL